MLSALPAESTRYDLSIVLPTLNERENIDLLIPQLLRATRALGVTSEILVVDSGSHDGTVAAAAGHRARVLSVVHPGYGEALRAGLQAASGRHVITMDADLSHEARVIADLWQIRNLAGIGIASRYVPGGAGGGSRVRQVLSRTLNAAYSRGLSLPVRDLTSGFRIYPANVINTLESQARDFDVLPEILVRAYAEGWPLVEIPFRYAPRGKGTSKARLLHLALAYFRTFARMWRLRNSINAADYDERAFASMLLPQRAWQRRRHAIITARALGSRRILDVGCGSSRILRDLPGAIGLDLSIRKLRYMRRYELQLVGGSIFALPFRDQQFDAVVCSEVIEHLPASSIPVEQLARVVRRGGRLIIGTPDYSRRSWRLIESLYRVLVPTGYAAEHITQYTHEQLRRMVVGLGYRHLQTDYVFGSEMILTFQREAS